VNGWTQPDPVGLVVKVPWIFYASRCRRVVRPP